MAMPQNDLLRPEEDWYMCERMIWIVLFNDLLCRTALLLLAATNACLTEILSARGL